MKQIREKPKNPSLLHYKEDDIILNFLYKIFQKKKKRKKKKGVTKLN